MTLQTLHVKNFQSIRDQRIEFGAFTVLVGKSNSGKSAILRALHTLARNSFVPAYVRQGASNAEVTAEFDAGTIRTTRGKESTYVLDEEIFTKCGRAVPDAVADFLSMPLVADEDVSFTNQFELPFLVGGKASRANNVVGAITNALLVGSLAQETSRLRLNTLQKITVRQSDLTDLQTELAQFDHLPELERALVTLQTLQEALYTCQERLAELQRLLTKAADAEASKVDVPPRPEVTGGDLDRLEELYAALRDLRVTLAAYDTTDVVIPPRPAVSDDDFLHLDRLLSRHQSLIDLIVHVQEHKRQVLLTRGTVTAAQQKLALIQHEVDQQPICPTCGQTY